MTGRAHISVFSTGFLGISLVMASLPACSFDSDEAAPPLKTMGTAPLNCGTTATVFPKLLTFIEEGRFAAIKEFVQRHLVAGAENPQPDVSVGTLISVAIKIVKSVGLDKTISLTELAANSEAIAEQKPLIMAALNFVNGKTDGKTHYEIGDAAAHFVRVCDPDHLLLAVERLAQFKSPSKPGRLWLDVMIKEVVALLENPSIDPFLQSFESDSQSGRPAIVSLIAQIMGFLRQPDFHISRVETLLDSVVYPIVSNELRSDIERMVSLLGEATDAEVGILPALQGALNCGMRYPPQRDVIIGFLFDVLVSDEIGLRPTLVAASKLVSADDSTFLLGIVAELIQSIRADKRTRDDLLEFVALALQQPDIGLILPTVSELIESGVVGELLDAIQTILGECKNV
jgi:hypothetical protein